MKPPTLKVRFTDDPEADAFRFSEHHNRLTVSRPKAREVLGEQATDAEIGQLGRKELRGMQSATA